ncbi:MAG TPA: UrcA family protein [Caulobacterales bacterium]|nr:UrcA family protein [Caulobacterales bacterium]
MRRSVIAVTTIALAALAAPASADPDKVQIRIQVTPADLESRESVALLYQRVEDAAASVCAEIMPGSFAPGTEPYSSPAACKRSLVRQALASTRIAPLADYYAALHGGRAGTQVATR